MPEEIPPAPETKRRIHWGTLILITIVVILLCIFLPPLINLSRFDRRISASISSSLGRPVHVDHAGIRILPTPALTLEDFIVSEDPAFGNEPVIRAASVTATLRVSSLWRRRIEISSISLDEPSINLTRNAAGDWNFKGILQQAASIPTAPTDPADPKTPAAANRPRFPYIEATNARVDFILGHEKLPFSLTDSDFALWQASDGKWHIRVRTAPARTDMNITDTGTVRLEGALGPSDSPAANAAPDPINNLPIALDIRWQDVQLGEFTRLITGRDLNWRGVLNSRTTLTGTLGTAQFHTVLNLAGFRSADIIPPDSLSLSLTCDATQQTIFQRVDNLLCTLPIPGDSGAPGTLSLAATLANPRGLLTALSLSDMDLHLSTRDLSQPPAATANAAADTTQQPAPAPTPDPGPDPGIDAATLLRILRRTNTRIPDSLTATGRITADLTYNSITTPAVPAATTPEPPLWRGSVHAENLALQLPIPPPLKNTPAATTPTTLEIPTATLTADQPPTQPHANQSHAKLVPPSEQTFTLQPVPLALGGTTPATLTGKFTANGYTLHLTGNATPQKLRALQTGIPWLLPTSSDDEDDITPEPTTTPHPEATHIDITTP